MSTPTSLSNTSTAAPVSADFKSILFPGTYASDEIKDSREPSCFPDLNLDQIVAAVTKGREEYSLAPFFYTRLSDPAQITYRHEIMRDLDDATLLGGVQAFAEGMRQMRKSLTNAQRFFVTQQKQRSFLNAVLTYTVALQTLSKAFQQHPPRARGLLHFSQHLAGYLASNTFTVLLSEAQGVVKALEAVRYSILVAGMTVTVSRFEEGRDYSGEVEDTFSRFQHGTVKDYRYQFTEPEEINQVETQILERVAQLHPEAFGLLDRFCTRFQNFADRAFTDFDREIQFYTAYLEYLAPLRTAGLRFCFPAVTKRCRQIVSKGGFDLALASKLVAKETSVVGNDFQLSPTERLIVVTGPNQGGKTTFARTFGQLHFLANLGCPVAGEQASFTLFDQLYTHFEREETITTLRSKLEDDLVRMHEIIAHASPDSIVIVNEIFSSTSLQDAVLLGRKVMQQLTDRDILCMCVTFLDELASLNDKTVSMVASIVPENPAMRTFRIERKPANGLAYAVALAEKYHLTHAHLQQRLPV